MVNNQTNLSAFTGPLPAAEAEKSELQISGGPLYKPGEVLELLRAEGGLVPWTKKCVKDLRDKLCIDNDGAAALVQEAIVSGRYRNSQWCQGKSSHQWAACDAYILKRDEYIPHARRELTIEYYVKFAIGRSGKVILLISCHNPEDRG